MWKLSKTIIYSVCVWPSFSFFFPFCFPSPPSSFPFFTDTGTSNHLLFLVGPVSKLSRDGGRFGSQPSHGSHNEACAGSTIRGGAKPRTVARTVGHRFIKARTASQITALAYKVCVLTHIQTHLCQQKDKVVSAKVTHTTRSCQSFYLFWMKPVHLALLNSLETWY